MLVGAGLDERARGNLGVGSDDAVGEAEGDEGGIGVEGLGAEGEDVAEAFGGTVLAGYGVVAVDAGGGVFSEDSFRVVDVLWRDTYLPIKLSRKSTFSEIFDITGTTSSRRQSRASGHLDMMWASKGTRMR